MTERICINCRHKIEYRSTPNRGYYLHMDTEHLHSDFNCICGCKSPAPAQEVKE